jgi:hypothetical protein
MVGRRSDHEHGGDSRKGECREEYGSRKSCQRLEASVEGDGQKKGEEHLHSRERDTQLSL